MKYHIHHGKAGQYGEIPTVSYRDEKNQTIASYSLSQPLMGVTLYSTPSKPHYRSLPLDEQEADRICLAYLLSLGFDEHEERQDTWNIKAYND